MKKTGLILGLLLVLSLAASGGWYLWQTKIKPPAVTPASSATTPFAAAPSLLTWNDPAGFTLQYPQDLTVNKHDEDKDNYAHLEFTHKDHPGSIIIWAKDTTAADITAWVRTEKTFAGASILDTTLGGQPAKKILLTGTTKKLFVGTIFDELLFLVEAQLDEEGYWLKIADTISQSFAFKPIPETEAAAGGVSQEEAVDEEEVIE